jgi:hypothetical protein
MTMMLLFSVCIGLQGTQAPIACDEDCQLRWVRERVRELDDLLPELVATKLQDLAAAEDDNARRRLLIQTSLEFAERGTEPYPVRSLLQFSDSESGRAVSLLRDYPTQLALRLRAIELLAARDLKDATDQAMELIPPKTTPASLARDEEVDLQSYYKTMLLLCDQLASAGDPIRAKLLILRMIGTANSVEAIVDLSAVLHARSQTVRLSSNTIDAYLRVLSRVPVDRPPSWRFWVFPVVFWRSLLKGEMVDRKGELLSAVAPFVETLSRKEPMFGDILFRTQVGEKTLPRTWPDEAITEWGHRILSLDFTDGEREVAKEIEAQLVSAKVLQPRYRNVKRTLFWSREESKNLFAALSEVNRKFREARETGAWEVAMASLITATQAHAPPARDGEATDEARMITFLEKQMVWRKIFAFSGYQARKPNEPIDAKQIAAEIAGRPDHAFKATALRDAIAAMHSEEGRWVYSRRPAFIIGHLIQLRNEVRNSQKEFEEEWNSLMRNSPLGFARQFLIR